MPPTRSYGFGEDSIRVSPSGSPWRGSGRGSRRSECWGARQGPREARQELGWATAQGWARRSLGVCAVCRIQLAHLHQRPATGGREARCEIRQRPLPWLCQPVAGSLWPHIHGTVPRAGPSRPW